MKKNYFLLIGLLAILLLMAVACSSSSDAAAPDTGADQSSASEPAQSGEATQEPVMESMTEGTGFCANDFYPLRSDKTWHYTIESLDQSSDYSITFKDVTDSSFTAMQTFPSLTNEITWQCSADGLLSSNLCQHEFPEFNIWGLTSPMKPSKLTALPCLRTTSGKLVKPGI